MSIQRLVAPIIRANWILSRSDLNVAENGSRARSVTPKRPSTYLTSGLFPNLRRRRYCAGRAGISCRSTNILPVSSRVRSVQHDLIRRVQTTTIFILPRVSFDRPSVFPELRSRRPPASPANRQNGRRRKYRFGHFSLPDKGHGQRC